MTDFLPGVPWLVVIGAGVAVSTYSDSIESDTIGTPLVPLVPIKKPSKPGNTRLQRRLQQIERLGTTEKRQVLQLIDAFIERGQLKKKVSG